MKPINEKNFVSFYKILGLKNGPQDENKIITDEMVEKAYINVKEQLVHLQEKAKTEEEKMYLQKIEESIKEAYRVLRTERGRKEYDELEKAMIKVIKDKKQENVKFTPIYKGKIGELPPKSREDDEGR